jgi:uncharacterized protein (DUF1697 family)
MASVVFFRAVNVGLHQRFQPGALAKKLADLGVVNIGAAGTFVVRGNISAAKLRAEILRHLPFKPELMICPAREVLAIADGKLQGKPPAAKGVTAFLSVLQKPPSQSAKLPADYPETGKWQVRIMACLGKFVLSWRIDGADLYANAVVEKHFGIKATTRNWNTVRTIEKVLAG